MNSAYSHVFFLNYSEIYSLVKIAKPKFEYKTKIVFNPKDFFGYEADEEPVCQFLLGNGCRFVEKCKNYHPVAEVDGKCMMCKAKVKASLRKFGLLSGCDDLFCYPCIRQWRSRGNVSPDVANSCPICGTISKELVASSIFPLKSTDRVFFIQHLVNKSQNDII